MVHGWIGNDTVATPQDRSGAFSQLIDLSTKAPYTANVHRSLIGQLQNIPGAAVFTFDYHPYSGRWVDDTHLGPALGKVIDCLFRASGHKVIIVAHSMGGLVARWAATHPGIAGADRSAELSTVVTFGTPELGSVLAMLVNGAIDAGASADTTRVLSVLRLILATCGTASSGSLDTGGMCDRLPAYVRALGGSAALALRAGSPQLAALPRWPRSIVLDAIAGDMTFEVAGGWFQAPWKTTSVRGVGDVLVTPSSALAAANPTESSSCDYQLNPIRGGTDLLGLGIKVVANSDVAQQPFASFVSGCLHTNLMREIHATNEALAAVSEDISARDRWIIDPTGIGPIKRGQTTRAQMAALLAGVSPIGTTCGVYMASGAPKSGGTGWRIVTASGHGVDGPYDEVDVFSNDPAAAVNAPETRNGITIGSPESQFVRLGISGNPTALDASTTMYRWVENGIPIVALATHGVVGTIAVNYPSLDWYPVCD